MTRPAEFSFRSRAKNLQTLAGEPFDVLVIGAGITGAGIARDAALRGLRVGLVERRDFAVGTSSRSSKLIHGGVRYLEHGDVALVMEASHERRVIRRLIPHLVRPTALIFPVQRRSTYAKLSAGLWTFDRMARVIKDERYHMLSSEETLRLEPSLRAEELYGAGMYYEYVTDDARLVIENIKSAAALGAVIANYAQVTGFVTAGDHLDAALVRDMITDAELTLRAKVVVNAAGPWVDGVRMLQGDSERPRLHLTKGIHLIVLRSRLPVSHIVIMTTADRRVVFAVPRGDLVYIGTTDTNYPAADDDPPVTVEDAQYLLDAANATFAIEPLGLRDIVGAWAGLRPLLHQEGKKPTEISRKDEIMVGPTGLVSIAGGKLTTYRKMAERVVDVALERLTKAGEPAPLKKGESEDERLSGGETGADIDAFAARLQQRWPQVAPDIVHRLVEVYGSNGERMVETMVGDPQLARRCTPGLALTRCEVAYAVREEMAMTLEDFLERRARLFLWDQHNGLTAASEVARWMGKLLGWDARRIDDEIAAYERHVREVKGFLLEPDAVAAPRVAHA